MAFHDNTKMKDAMFKAFSVLCKRVGVTVIRNAKGVYDAWSDMRRYREWSLISDRAADESDPVAVEAARQHKIESEPKVSDRLRSYVTGPAQAVVDEVIAAVDKAQMIAQLSPASAAGSASASSACSPSAAGSPSAATAAAGDAAPLRKRKQRPIELEDLDEEDVDEEASDTSDDDYDESDEEEEEVPLTRPNLNAGMGKKTREESQIRPGKGIKTKRSSRNRFAGRKPAAELSHAITKSSTKTADALKEHGKESGNSTAMMMMMMESMRQREHEWEERQEARREERVRQQRLEDVRLQQEAQERQMKHEVEMAALREQVFRRSHG
jgi:hypothetical protein